MAQLVAHLVWDQGVARSSRVIPTIQPRTTEKGISPVEGYIVKHAFRHFLPAAILTGIIVELRVITDGIIVSHLIGPSALSAINFYMPLDSALEAMISIFALGASFLAARRMGRQDYRGASHLFATSLIGTTAIIALLTALCALFLQPLVSLLASGEASVVRDYTATYLRWMLPTFLVMAPNIVLRCFVNIDGKPRLVTASILTSFLLNPFLDVILIRFTGLGIAGAAIATLLSDLAGLAILVVHFLRKKTSFRFQMPASWASLLRASILIGIPLAASQFLFAALDLVLNRIVLFFKGMDGIFIWAVVMEMISLCEMFIVGVAEMNQSFGGMLLGSSDFKAFRAYVRRTLRFLCITLLAISVFLLAFPQLFFTLFGADGETAILTEGCRVLRIMSLLLVPLSLITFFENIHAIVGRERLALTFEIAQAAAMVGVPLVAGLICPALFWWSFPLQALLLFAIQLTWTWRIQKREHNVRAPFLEEVFPTDVEADFSVNFTRKSVDMTMEKIRKIAAICELPAGKENALVNSCGDLMNRLLVRRASDKSMRNGFEIRLVDKPDQTQVTFKTIGRPLQLMTEPLDQSGDRIDYKYLYGVNVTYLAFQK